MAPPTKENILDLPLRRTIVDAISSTPGIHLRALAGQLDIAVSTLEYHCYQLVRTGHLNTRETGGFKAFYPAEGMDRRDKDLLYILRQDAPRRICSHLLLHPGATPKDLKVVLGLSGATMSFHLSKLRKAEMLHEVVSGRTKLLSIVDEERVANVLVTYQQSFVDQTVDRFAAAWLDLHPPRKVQPAEEADVAGRPGTPEAPESSKLGGEENILVDNPKTD